MTITVAIKNVYGTDMIYPVCDNGKLFTRLTGKKTLSQSDIATIKHLGYTITVQTPEL